MKRNISLEEAQTLLLHDACPVGEERVPLALAAERVLSRDMTAPADLPSFDKSPLDGYALRAVDTVRAKEENPVVLEVIEEVAAGYAAAKKVLPGTAIKVMTGAPIPEGADVVIRFEDVIRSGNSVQLSCPLKSGSNIIRTGEDVKTGETIAEKGTLIVPAFSGSFAALGCAKIPVFKRVKVAIASTGDELVDVSQPTGPGKIYNSNLYSLVAACSRLGAQVEILGNVVDQVAAVAAKIEQGLQLADIVITTGGVSVGDYDAVPEALESIGAEVLFRGVNIKPGSPAIAARKDGKFILCLSGNPAAALITFELIAVPLLKKMMGLSSYLPAQIQAVFNDDFIKPSSQRRFLRGHFHLGNEVNFVTLTGGQSNGMLQSMVNCNVLVDVPGGSGKLQKGQKVMVMIIGDINGR